jgi:hypothetical protein
MSAVTLKVAWFYLISFCNKFIYRNVCLRYIFIFFWQVSLRPKWKLTTCRLRTVSPNLGGGVCWIYVLLPPIRQLHHWINSLSDGREITSGRNGMSSSVSCFQTSVCITTTRSFSLELTWKCCRNTWRFLPSICRHPPTNHGFIHPCYVETNVQSLLDSW